VRLHYAIDGTTVTATCPTARYPRVYEVRVGNGPLLGYVERSLLGRTEAYTERAAPHTDGAQSLGTYLSMRDAIERVIRSNCREERDPEVHS
jgi:hypothetical protein